jgi:DNA repair exonuclease SbcCD ATPase subunit
MVAGFILGGIFRFTLAPLGFIISTALALSVLFGNKSKKELSFFDKYNKKGVSISDIEAQISRYDQLNSKRADIRASLSDEYSDLTLKVCEFLGKFPVSDANSMLGAVRVIKNKYNRYYALGMATEVSASGKLDKLKRSEMLASEVREFLAKFPTVTNDPFAEIRANHIAYLQHRSNISRLEAECDEYAVKHGVTGANLSDNNTDEAALRLKLNETTEKAKELAAKISLVERDIATARGQLECKDEYEMAKDEYEELHRTYQGNYSAIQKAMLYLTEACDNITYKYLGKTKERFEEYSSLIAGADGEYTLNTSFELMRTERGESHGIDSYSRGIRDLYSLGLRLALIDALYENEAPFIILDDPFIAFDDEKLERAKSTLKSISKTKQILYFTCSDSRAIK